MAKVSFTKLGLKLNQEVKTMEWNEQIIEVKQYLPINKKLELISNVINLSVDETNFANPVKVKVYLSLEIIEAYTNINFTEKQKDDICKLYDLFNNNGLIKAIIDKIPQEEYDELAKGTWDSIDAIYDYRNSLLGILESAASDYSNLSLDATDIQQKLADPNNMTLLKDVLAKLG